MGLSITRPDSTTVVLKSTEGEALELDGEFLRYCNSGEQSVVLDLEGVKFLPLDALNRLVNLASTLKSQGRVLTLVAPEPEIRDVFRVCRLDLLFPPIETKPPLTFSMASRVRTTTKVRSSVATLPSKSNPTMPATGFEDFVIDENDRRFASDWAFVEEQLNRGNLEPFAGEFVGIYMREVVAHGDSERSVRQQFEAARGIRGDQLAVLWVPNDEIR